MGFGPLYLEFACEIVKTTPIIPINAIKEHPSILNKRNTSIVNTDNREEVQVNLDVASWIDREATVVLRLEPMFAGFKPSKVNPVLYKTFVLMARTHTTTKRADGSAKQLVLLTFIVGVDLPFRSTARVAAFGVSIFATNNTASLHRPSVSILFPHCHRVMTNSFCHACRPSKEEIASGGGIT